MQAKVEIKFEEKRQIDKTQLCSSPIYHFKLSAIISILLSNPLFTSKSRVVGSKLIWNWVEKLKSFFTHFLFWLCGSALWGWRLIFGSCTPGNWIIVNYQLAHLSMKMLNMFWIMWLIYKSIHRVKPWFWSKVRWARWMMLKMFWNIGLIY